jgi:outer membrane protein OmpA-like peptidoglycan-associated protein
MKKIFILALCGCMITTLNAQTIVKEHYTVSGGLLGAVNLSEFRIKNNPINNADYDMETGWGAGAWLNLPIAKWFSIEPQVQYNSYRYNAGSTNPALLLTEGKIRYISVPVLLKFHLGDKVALIAGPQVDIITGVTDKNKIATKDDFNKSSYSAFGGLEVFPHGRVTIFGRYVHGLSNMDSRGTEVDDAKYKNQNIQAGLKFKLFGKKVPADSDGDGVSDPKDKCPNVVGVARYDGCPIPDTDNDGINDEQDKCPTQAGTAKYNGCPIPDSDNDGINDELDKCPTQAGTAKYNGCPVPDTDGDGINDELDKCPTQAGPANRNGCPVTDRDNDGVSDDEDKCPDLAGTSANRGCPDVPANVSKGLQAASQKIAFGTGANNAKLATKSNASLNQIVTIMNENPGLRVRIEGHTSDVGNDDTNMTLSENRAAAVKAYLVSKGISEDRITSEGFGETMPIADNTSAAGRTKNNRVEIKVSY